jgi:hypothetical protein
MALCSFHKLQVGCLNCTVSHSKLRLTAEVGNKLTVALVVGHLVGVKLDDAVPEVAAPPHALHMSLTLQ